MIKYLLIEILHQSNWFNSHLPFQIWFFCHDANRRSINLLFDTEDRSHRDGKTPKKENSMQVNISQHLFLIQCWEIQALNLLLKDDYLTFHRGKSCMVTDHPFSPLKSPTSLVEAPSLQHLNHPMQLRHVFCLFRWLIHPLVSLNKGLTRGACLGKGR